MSRDILGGVSEYQPKLAVYSPLQSTNAGQPLGVTKVPVTAWVAIRVRPDASNRRPAADRAHSRYRNVTPQSERSHA